MANEFYRRGTSEVYWLAAAPAIPASITTVEVAAGINLSAQLNAVDGFSFSTTFIDVENLASRVTTTISGPSKADGGTLTFNEKRAASGATSGTYDNIMDALDVDAAGYLAFFPYGVANGNDYELWAVRVGSFSRQWDLGNTPAKWMSEMAATGVPIQHGTVGAYAVSLAVAPTTAAIDVSDALAKKIVATATLSDATTANVSGQCTWTSSDVTKATVTGSSAGGWVLGVGAGTCTVTATYVSPTGTTLTATTGTITVTA
jgi:hypothetical protein